MPYLRIPKTQRNAPKEVRSSSPTADGEVEHYLASVHESQLPVVELKLTKSNAAKSARQIIPNKPPKPNIRLIGSPPQDVDTLKP